MPTNADNTEHGPLLATDALRYSLNVPSVMMQHLVGPEATAEFAESMGIASADYIMELQPGLTLALGSVPVNLTNMTNAYGVFAQRGVLHQPTTILEIRDRYGRLVYSRKDDAPEPSRPMTAAEAYLTHWILRGNTDPDQNVIWGPNAFLTDPSGRRREAGFKTGTTNDFRDVSGFGYVPGGLVTGVWMGNNNMEPLSNALGQGVFSADGPMRLWRSFMQTALNQRSPWNGRQPVEITTFERPDGVVMEQVCKFSGMRATSSCGETREMPFLEGTVPPPDNVHPNGCLDVELAVARDNRRPPEWVQAAEIWANRLVNRQTGSFGDPTELKENPSYRLRIAPLPGNTGFGSICGQFFFTPRPDPTDNDGGGPGPRTEKPRPTNCPGNSCGDDDDRSAATIGDPLTLGMATPILGLTSVLSLAGVALGVLRRRRGPHASAAWDNRPRVHRRPDADPGGG
jgi:membrane peptidoglycan carboxypeptidase